MLILLTYLIAGDNGAFPLAKLFPWRHELEYGMPKHISSFDP